MLTYMYVRAINLNEITYLKYNFFIGQREATTKATILIILDMHVMVVSDQNNILPLETKGQTYYNLARSPHLVVTRPILKTRIIMAPSFYNTRIELWKYWSVRISRYSEKAGICRIPCNVFWHSTSRYFLLSFFDIIEMACVYYRKINSRRNIYE